MTYQDRVQRAQVITEGIVAQIEASSGDRAALRRLVGRTPDSPHARPAHRILARHVADAAFGTPREWAVYTVAGMLADDPHPSAGTLSMGSFGAALGRAVRTGVLADAPTAARLESLCGQRLAGLHRYLPSLVEQLRGRGQPVGWARLMVDLGDWEERRHLIGRRWLRDYSRATPTLGDDPPLDTAPDGAGADTVNNVTTTTNEGAHR